METAGRDAIGRRRKYFSEDEKKAGIAAQKLKYKRDNKVLLLVIKGGECVGCGLKYNGRNAACFHFHHVDPATKEFHLKMNTRFDKLEAEVEKCVILCANCHALHHSEEY